MEYIHTNYGDIELDSELAPAVQEAVERVLYKRINESKCVPIFGTTKIINSEHVDTMNAPRLIRWWWSWPMCSRMNWTEWLIWQELPMTTLPKLFLIGVLSLWVIWPGWSSSDKPTWIIQPLLIQAMAKAPISKSGYCGLNRQICAFKRFPKLSLGYLYLISQKILF